jgi:hypothetical protein
MKQHIDERIVTLGIDPGTTKTAFTLLSVDGGNYSILEKGKVDNEDMLTILRGHGFGILGTRGDKDARIYIEGMQSYGMAVGKETFETCYLIGRILEIAEFFNIDITMLFRKDIVQHHCLTTKAKDKNVRAALIERFGDPGKKASPGMLYGVSSDMWSSTAIAVMGADLELKKLGG